MLPYPCGYRSLESYNEETPWNSENTNDLVTISNEVPDTIADYMNEKILPHYHHWFGDKVRWARKKVRLTKDEEKAMDIEEKDLLCEYKRERFVFFGNVLCTIVSSAVPTTSILMLYFVQNMLVRLAITGLMSFLFSCAMMVVADGRRQDVFAATSAFAAVQVVFVGGTQIITSLPNAAPSASVVIA